MKHIPNFEFLVKSLHPFEVRLVGGAVRDIILGNEPKDYDFSTTALPPIVTELVEKAGGKVRPTGLQHGTVTVITNDGATEVTTLRVDKTTDGRHAEVEFTNDWHLDASRRDFTINAMSMDIHGEIYDYFNGQEDLLLNNEVKFVGKPEERIKEDYLRILRYFRFCSKMNNNVVSYVEKEVIPLYVYELNLISGERILNELRKIFSFYNKNGIIYRMNYSGVLDAIHIPFRNSEIYSFMNMIKEREKFELIIASLLRNETEVLKFHTRNKTKAIERDLILFLVENKNKNFDEHQFLYYLNNGYSLDKLECLTRFKNDKIILDMIKTGHYPKFSLTETDVAKNKNILRKNIKSTFNYLLDYWMKTSYRPTRQELLDKIEEYV